MELGVRLNWKFVEADALDGDDNVPELNNALFRSANQSTLQKLKNENT